MAAWALLTLAQRLSITDIHVIGDSKIIIDWLNNIGSLQAISIECWKDRVKDLINYFSVITFAHVYREENQAADTLSKKALSERTGAIAYNQWMDGQEGPIFFYQYGLVSFILVLVFEIYLKLWSLYVFWNLFYISFGLDGPIR
jgi:hypothetical protein